MNTPGGLTIIFHFLVVLGFNAYELLQRVLVQLMGKKH